MIIDIPSGATMIIKTLENNGYEAYVVGGCVRDKILGKEPNDWDICTNAIPSEVTRIFSEFRVIETGLKHGTVTVMTDDEKYEVTTYRTESNYLDYRHPDQVMFVTDITEDLARRDFTINAMAYNDRSGLVDCYGGLKDLESGIIRCVNNPYDRFTEDALRIMRALRFASSYGLTIEKDTAEAIHALKSLLNHIAAERINSEFTRLLCGNGIANVLREFHDVIEVFIPEVRRMVGLEQRNPYHKYDVFEHSIRATEHIEQDKILRLAMFFHDMGKPVAFTVGEDGRGHFYAHPVQSERIVNEVMERLKYDNETSKAVKVLVAHHDAVLEPTEKSVKRWINKIGEEAFYSLLKVQDADTSAQSDLSKELKIRKIRKLFEINDRIIAENQCFKLKDLNINGNDLLAIGVKQGKKVGEILNKLLDMVMDGEVENNFEELRMASIYLKEV